MKGNGENSIYEKRISRKKRERDEYWLGLGLEGSKRIPVRGLIGFGVNIALITKAIDVARLLR